MKAVFFDFDGTLTYKSPNIWKSIWSNLGYEVGEGSEYKRQLNAYLNGDITYGEWTNQTLDKYKDKKMNLSLLNRLANIIKLIHGASETFKKLTDSGYSLHVLSGNITLAVKQVLGENLKYFTSINANNFLFDNNGNLTDIIPTEFDFEGKAEFIKKYIERHNCSAEDLYFVGNGINDEFAYTAGCTTICVNPYKEVDLNTTKWNYIIQDMQDLSEILKYIKV